MPDRESNRAAFPFAAQLLDDLRTAFPNARVLYAMQDGREIGRREDGYVAKEWPCATHACGTVQRLPKDWRR